MKCFMIAKQYYELHMEMHVLDLYMIKKFDWLLVYIYSKPIKGSILFMIRRGPLQHIHELSDCNFKILEEDWISLSFSILEKIRTNVIPLHLIVHPERSSVTFFWVVFSVHRLNYLYSCISVHLFVVKVSFHL